MKLTLMDSIKIIPKRIFHRGKVLEFGTKQQDGENKFFYKELNGDNVVIETEFSSDYTYLTMSILYGILDIGGALYDKGFEGNEEIYNKIVELRNMEK